MSDSESGDGMEELQAIVDEYSAKEKQSKTGKPVVKQTTKDEPIEWIKSEEEIRLDKLIFGDKEGLLENLKKSSSKPYEDAEEPEIKKRKPAWEDEDDNIKMGEVRRRTLLKDQPLKDQLKSKFNRVVKTPKWADLDRKADVDSDEEILRTVGFLAKPKSNALPSRDIHIKILKDLNRTQCCEGMISSIQFHPTSTVAMVSGQNGIATLYSVDGVKNKKIHRIRLDDFMITGAKILNCGTKALFNSNKKHYYSYDLMQATETRHLIPRNCVKITDFEVSPDGKYFTAFGHLNELHLFDMKSKEFIYTFKQEDPVNAAKFSVDCDKIITSSNGSTVNIFDIRRQRVMHTFLDDGCIKGRALAISPDGKMLATGSFEGAVNVYDYDKVFKSKTPQPEKTILNLTTGITRLNFNHTSEILGITSGLVRGAVKLVHFPTGTVFANYPGPLGKTKYLQKVRDIEFSPSSGYMALGSEKEAKLYRLKHFSNY